MAKQELTFDEFCSKPMELVMHISAEKEHYSHRINREIGVQKITVTRKDKHGGFGASRNIYILDSDPNNYKTADQVYVAYMSQVCGVSA